MLSKAFLLVEVDPFPVVNNMFTHAQDAATWAGVVVFAFMGFLAIAAIAAYVVNSHF